MFPDLPKFQIGERMRAALPKMPDLPDLADLPDTAEGWLHHPNTRKVLIGLAVITAILMVVLIILEVTGKKKAAS